MTKPIKPSEVSKAKVQSIPDEVFEAFNELITENFDGREACILQNDAVKRIKKKMPDVTSEQMFKKGWLDVEGAYQKVGWRVIYDKPGYNEDYEANFRFVKR